MARSYSYVHRCPECGQQVLASPDLMTTTEAARVIGCSIGSILNWARAGRIPHTLTPGGHRRFAANDVQRFAASWRRRGVRDGD